MSDSRRNEKKHINKVRIAKYILHQGETSKPEIASELNISMPTVLQNIKELEEGGVVAEVGEYQSTGGRKAKAISIKNDCGYAVGIDITANHISYVMIDLCGKLVGHERVRHVFENTMDYYENLSEELAIFIKKAAVDKKKILGVGVSFPGIIDKTNDMIIRSHILELSNVSLKNIRQQIPYEVMFENDANSAALAEVMGSREDAVYLSLSNSVGGAIYMNHSIFVGDNFKSAEFGHLIIDANGKECYCGKKGCADAYCNARILAGITNNKLNDFFTILEQGDQKCRKAWQEYLDYLAVTVSNLRMTFDCNIILGGYVGAYLPPYMNELSRKVMEYNKFESDTAYIRNCKYTTEAAATGIAMTFVEKYFEQLK